jgi:WD40 repeat protein
MEADTHSYVYDLAFSPDGQSLVARSDGNTVRLWRVSNGALLRTFVHRDSVSGLAFTPGGQTLASVSKGTTLSMWRLP